MPNAQAPRQWDLHERTFNYARRVLSFCRQLPKDPIQADISQQMVRSAASVGANYIEANDALGKKDFTMRVRICRKEARESAFWLRLSETPNPELSKERDALVKESTELVKIFSAIIAKTE